MEQSSKRLNFESMASQKLFFQDSALFLNFTEHGYIFCRKRFSRNMLFHFLFKYLS